MDVDAASVTRGSNLCTLIFNSQGYRDHGINFFVLYPPRFDIYIDLRQFIYARETGGGVRTRHFVSKFTCIRAAVRLFEQTVGFKQFILQDRFRINLDNSPVYLRQVIALTIMATLEGCSAYHVLITTVSYMPRQTSLLDADTPASIAAMGIIKADKIAKAILTGDRSKLKLEGNIKSQHWQDFCDVLFSITTDYSLLFENLLDLNFDQHATISSVQASLDALPVGGHLYSDPLDNASAEILNTDTFKFNSCVNSKLYGILLLVTDGHANEILKRVTNRDGRMALLALKQDAIKQTDGQVITLQSQINTFVISSTKSPAGPLDTLLKLCKELDCLLKFQGSQYGPGQVKAAVLHSLPDEYKAFRIARDNGDSSSQTVDTLVTSITNHFSNYIGGANRNDDHAKASTSNGSNGSSKPSTNSGKGKGKGNGAKRKAGRAAKAGAKGHESSSNDNGNRGTRKSGNANAADTNRQELRDCIICSQLDNHPNDIKHLFKDCPTLTNFKNKGSSIDHGSNQTSSGKPNANGASGSSGDTRRVTFARDAPDL